MTDAAPSLHPICPVCEMRHAPLSSVIHRRAEASRFAVPTTDVVAVQIDPPVPSASSSPRWLSHAAKDLTPKGTEPQ